MLLKGKSNVAFSVFVKDGILAIQNSIGIFASSSCGQSSGEASHWCGWRRGGECVPRSAVAAGNQFVTML